MPQQKQKHQRETQLDRGLIRLLFILEHHGKPIATRKLLLKLRNSKAGTDVLERAQERGLINRVVGHKEAAASAAGRPELLNSLTDKGRHIVKELHLLCRTC